MTASKLLLALLLISSCHLVSNNLQHAPPNARSNKALCLIDTETILANHNLSPLINDLEHTELTISKKASAIPDFIMDFLKCAEGDTFTIADPGEKWQVTDVVTEKLPDRQLIFFGMGNGVALLVHYTGGIGESVHILIFKFKNRSISDFWCGTVLTDFKDKNEIVEYLKAHRNEEDGLNTNIIYF